MNVVRLDAAPAYEAPGHNLMRMLRLQGREAGASDVLWVGLSHILPGGGTTLDASPLEKMYVVLDGEVTISNGTEEVTLRPWDSCRIAPDEPRALSNRTNRPATILLAMPVAPA
ncbi:MAG TPA: cupin domain-containing protein [Beijerinckiaceae bacterium]|jgi:mannose-6-phosphate isomerase-like protein (cupin superfamily)